MTNVNQTLAWELCPDPPRLEVERLPVATPLRKLLPRELARDLGVVPIGLHGHLPVIAMSEGAHADAARRLEGLLGYDIEVVFASHAAIDEALARYCAA